jgi:hypothetical protein
MAEKPTPEDSITSKDQVHESVSEKLGTQTLHHRKGDAFVGGGATELYEPIPEYEGRHRYDPGAEWTEKEEKRLVRKVSIFISCFLVHSELSYVL